jgi:hypothetical protein
MNRLRTTIATAAFATLAFAGVSQAALWSSNGPLGPQIDHSVHALKTKNFVVSNVADLPAGDPVSNYTANGVHAADIKKLQAAIESNKTLVKELKAQNIEFRNIVAVDEAANGSYTFYVE